MKILHIINSLNTGGAEKLLVETLPLYEKKNIEVDLLLLSKKEAPFENLLNNTFKGSVYHSNIKHLYSPLQIFQIIKHIRKKVFKKKFFSENDLKEISYIGNFAVRFSEIIDTKIFD